MRRIAVLSGLVTLLVLLALAQLVLPGIAANRLRSQLSRYGEVQSVHVSAFPAIQLLWHHADSVRIAMRSYRSASTQMGSLLAGAGDAGTIDVTADEVEVGLLRVRDASLHKRGKQLAASARISETDLRAAVPFLDGVVPVAGQAGGITLRGSATVLGVTASVDVTTAPRDGALVVAPDVPLGGLATITLFSDPRVVITGVSASSAPGGFMVSATGYLR